MCERERECGWEVVETRERECLCVCVCICSYVLECVWVKVSLIEKKIVRGRDCLFVYVREKMKGWGHEGEDEWVRKAIVSPPPSWRWRGATVCVYVCVLRRSFYRQLIAI